MWQPNGRGSRSGTHARTYPFAGLAAIPASSGPHGGTIVPFPIPSVAALRGQSCYLQFAWPDTGAPKGLSASPGLQVTVQ